MKPWPLLSTETLVPLLAYTTNSKVSLITAWDNYGAASKGKVKHYILVRCLFFPPD